MKSKWMRMLMTFFAALLFFAGSGGTAEAASVTWGNNSENILNGGVLAADGDTVYYSNTEKEGRLYSLKGEKEKKLTSDTAANINVIGKKIYYTTDKNSGSVVRCYNLSTGRKTSVFTTSAKIDEMYVNSKEVFYYLSKGCVYSRKSTQKKSTKESGSGKIVHFIPTSYGLITARGSAGNYKLYADGEKIRSGVSSFYTVDRYLIFSASGKDYQAKLSELFGGSPSAAVKKYTLGDNDIDGLQATLSQTSDCAVCEENAKEVASGKKIVDDIDAVASSGTTSLLNDSSVSDGQRNIVKRARQQHEISWTPLANITGWNGAYTFYSGTTYTGLPYGQPVYNSGYVPWNVSLDEFAAAVANKGSKMYSSKSTYNKTAPYYSCDCSSFVSWAWDLPSRQTTSTIAGYATKVSTQSIYSVQIGDAFNLAGSHVVLVYDVGCNSDGDIVYIDIIEQTPPQTKLTRYGEGGSYTLAYMSYKYLQKNTYTLYRCKKRDSVSYTPSAAVTLDNDSKISLGKVSLGEAAATTSGGIKVSWSSVSGAQKYEVMRKNSAGEWEKIATTTSCSYTDNSVKPRTSYTYTVRAVSTTGGKTYYGSYDTKGVSATSLMEAVNLKTISRTSTSSLKLTWSAVDGAEGYRVYRKTATSWKKLGETTKCSWKDTGLSLGSTYTYTVRAYTTTSGGSKKLGAYDAAGLSKKCMPPTPTLKSAAADTNGKITVTWGSASGAAGYRLYRRKAGESKWRRVVTQKGTSYKDSGLTSGTTYQYTVRAYRKVSGKTYWSSYNKTGISAETTLLLPAQPALKSAVSSAYGEITLKWKKADNAEGYRVYRLSESGKWKRLTETTKTSYKDTDIEYGRTYTYTVRAYRLVDKQKVLSTYEKAGISCTAKPPTPSLTGVESTKKGTAVVNWKAMTGIDGFRVYYRESGGKWKAVGNAGKTMTYRTVKSLKSGSRYLFAVRSFWKVKGKKYYSAYAKTTAWTTAK